MPERIMAASRSRSRVHLAGLLFVVLSAMMVAWFFAGPAVSGSDPLIVIEDASASPTGVFPGTVCYELVRDHDSAVITQGCLKLAATISAPAGLDRSVLYTLSITVNAPGCTLLDDLRTGSGFTPFRIRIACAPLNGDRSFEWGEPSNGQSGDPYGAASASPIAMPESSAP